MYLFRCSPSFTFLRAGISCLACCLFFPSLTTGATPLLADRLTPTADSQKPPYEVQSVAFLEDSSGKLSSEDVQSPRWAKRFRPNFHQTPAFGFTRSAIWGRVEIAAREDVTVVIELSTPRLDHVDWYEVHEAGSTLSDSNGSLDFPIKPRVSQAYPSIICDLSAGESTTILFRVTSECSVTIPLSITDEQTFLNLSSLRLYIGHLQVGGSIAVTVLCLLLSITFRESGFLILGLTSFAGLVYGVLYDPVACLPEIALPPGQVGLAVVSR